jgi:LPXTG-motif cell wall-anchored protein
VSANGITISGLLPGDYKLQEKMSPDGYIIMTGDIEFTINPDGTVKVTGRNEDSYGKITYSDGASNLVTFMQKKADANAEVFVENEPGVVLPSTGGMGTGAVYGAGAAVILLALLGLVLMNRKRSRGTGI